MIITNSQVISILSRPEIDESYIADITYEHEQTIINPQTHEPYQAHEAETVYHYQFYFVANLREALDLQGPRKVHSLGSVGHSGFNSIRISIRESLPISQFSTFSHLGQNPSSAAVLASVYGQAQDNMNAIFYADQAGLMYRTEMSLLKFFDSFKLRNARILSDNELFGTIEKTKVIDVEEFRQQGMNPMLAPA